MMMMYKQCNVLQWLLLKSTSALHVLIAFSVFSLLFRNTDAKNEWSSNYLSILLYEIFPFLELKVVIYLDTIICIHEHRPQPESLYHLYCIRVGRTLKRVMCTRNIFRSVRNYATFHTKLTCHIYLAV